jgi:DNA-binding CsgD family transcriptional regulator
MRLGLSAGQLGDLCDALYEAAFDRNGWSSFLTLLSSHYGHSLAAAIFYDSLASESNFRAVSDLGADLSSSYDGYYGKINPIVPVSRRMLPLGGARISSDLIPSKEFQGTEFYQGFFRPNNLERTLTVLLKREEHLSIAFSIAVGPGWFDRDPAALSRLQLLAPHLTRAVQIQNQLSDLGSVGDVTMSVLERMQAALIIIDDKGKVISLSTTAERILSAADGLKLENGNVVAYNAIDDARLQSTIGAALAAQADLRRPPGDALRISKISGFLSPYEVLVTPAFGKPAALGLRRPAAYLFVRDPSQRQDAPIARLRSLYGLSGAESRLFRELLNGHQLDFAADRLGITKGTARTVLKTIFRKTGVNRQSDLIGLGLLGVSNMAEGETH